MALTRVEQLPPSIAQSRGKDWGLPERPADAIPITRPIRVLCESDRLTLLTHDPTQRPQVIRLGEQTQDGIDDLVAGVWEHTRQWGMAGRGLYWRPVLRFDVRPGGEQRFRELEALLRDSGLPVQDGTVRR